MGTQTHLDHYRSHREHASEQATKNGHKIEPKQGVELALSTSESQAASTLYPWIATTFYASLAVLIILVCSCGPLEPYFCVQNTDTVEDLMFIAHYHPYIRAALGISAGSGSIFSIDESLLPTAFYGLACAFVAIGLSMLAHSA